MTRQEYLFVLSGVVTAMDDAQLSELYAYAVHMQKRSEPVAPKVSEIEHILGMLTASDGEKQASTPKRIAKRERPRKVKV